MRLSRLMPCAGLLGFILILAGPAARADLAWTVSVDTSHITNYTGPFALDFELLGTNGNTVTLTNFSFGSGSAGPGPAYLTGGASGNLGSSVSLNDTGNFFSDFNQQFTPGSTLTFTMDSTLVAPPSGVAPDNFSMVIFSGYNPSIGYPAGTPTTIHTTDPSENDTFFNFNINGPGLTTVDSFNTPSGDITITVTPAIVVPEPSSGVIVLLSVVCTAAAIFWRRNGVGRKRVVEL